MPCKWVLQRWFRPRKLDDAKWPWGMIVSSDERNSMIQTRHKEKNVFEGELTCGSNYEEEAIKTTLKRTSIIGTTFARSNSNTVDSKPRKLSKQWRTRKARSTEQTSNHQNNGERRRYRCDVKSASVSGVRTFSYLSAKYKNWKIFFSPVHSVWGPFAQASSFYIRHDHPPIHRLWSSFFHVSIFWFCRSMHGVSMAQVGHFPYAYEGRPACPTWSKWEWIFIGVRGSIVKSRTTF